MFQYPIFYTTDAHFCSPSVKIGFISFFSSPDMQNFHHVLGCQAVGINYSLIIFLSVLLSSNLICQAKILIRIIVSRSPSPRLLSRLILFKIYIENTNFITRKYGNTRIFIKLGCIFICLQSSLKFFNHLTCNKPIGNTFHCC